MKLAVVGSRSFTNYEYLKTQVNNLIMNKQIIIDEIVSGGANGVDKLAEAYADEYKIKKVIIKPDYDNTEMVKKYGKERWGKMAPLARNETIAKYADHMIAFPYTKTNGTENAINHMKKLNKPIDVFIIDEFI